MLLFVISQQLFVPIGIAPNFSNSPVLFNLKIYTLDDSYNANFFPSPVIL